MFTTNSDDLMLVHKRGSNKTRTLKIRFVLVSSSQLKFIFNGQDFKKKHNLCGRKGKTRNEYRSMYKKSHRFKHFWEIF